MLRSYGDRAPERALSRAREVLREGDADAHARWCRVGSAARRLLAETIEVDAPAGEDDDPAAVQSR